MKRSINNKTPNKGGRPTKRLSEKRKYRITVKMATEEYYAMKLKAKNAGWLSVIAISGHDLPPNKRTISANYAAWQTISISLLARLIVKV